MTNILLLTSAYQPSAEVIPGLALLAHPVKVLPAEGSALLDAPHADLLLGVAEAASRERTKGVASEEERARRERSLREAPHGSTVPFYERILGDDEGNLWVEEFTVPGEPPAGWTVFGTEGRLLGTVDLPEEFRPLHIGSDFVLGVATDDLGVERVRMYRLEKGGGR